MILLVVISSPLYTCILSELMISELSKNRVARSIERRDLPAPVGPIMATIFRFRRRVDGDIGETAAAIVEGDSMWI